MRIEIDLRKGLQRSASGYFESAKVARRKLSGVRKAMAHTLERIEKTEKEKSTAAAQEPKKKRAKKWFEKFRWFNSSDGILVIAGRDAQSNETLVKKHTDKTDAYFHAEMHGAPHVIAKSEGGTLPEQTMREAAVFAASYSSAWREGLAAVDVYSARPEQVSKKAPSGEALGAGAFMVYGERKWFRKTPLQVAVGLLEEAGHHIIMAGPPSAVRKNTAASVGLLQGTEEKGAVAKKIIAALGKKYGKKITAGIDEVVAALPSGGCRLGD